jgi:mycothiol synthase
VEVREILGLEHLPWAEAWFLAIDEGAWREASRVARALGKTGLEAWTYEDRPEVVAFLAARGYEEVRRYLRLELDVAAAPDPEPPGVPLVTLAARPDLARGVYGVALEAIPDQPGREDVRLGAFEEFRAYGIDRHRPDAFFVALDGDRVVGFGHLEVEGDVATHGMTAVARHARGRGVATALKRAQIAWAKANGIRTLRTANEVRIAAIRRLNERYGYRPLPAEVVLRGPLAPID